MADIEAKCPQCGKVIMVSEFADLARLTCRACNSPFKKPESAAAPVIAPPPKSTSKLRVQRDTPPTPAATQEPAQATARQDGTGGERVVARIERKENADKPVHVRQNLYSWLIFIILGGACGYLRYGNGLSPDWLAMFAEYGWIIMVAFHIIVVLKAFKDSVFQGVLCLLIPFYSLYYLFAVSDDFYMRSAIGGLLVLVGQDGAEHFRILFGGWFKAAGDWIQSGGGDIR